MNSDINATGGISNYATGLGEGNATKGSNWFQSILSGDPTRTAQALAPQINSLKTSVQQNQKSSDLTGNRSGGKAAGNAAASDKVHSDITNLTGELTGGAASTLLSSGSGLLGTALSGYGEQAGLDKERMDNWAKSILGSSITGAINYGESFLPVAHGGRSGGSSGGSSGGTPAGGP